MSGFDSVDKGIKDPIEKRFGELKGVVAEFLWLSVKAKLAPPRCLLSEAKEKT